MGRKIVVFADGTGNSASSTTKTNVWRLYEALDLNGVDQIAVFDDGVGTQSFKPLRVLGLAFGYGLKRNVLDLYKFLCRNYRDGDQIYGFGFSRGAYTIRVLNGLVNREGLVEFTSEEHLDQQARAAYREFRKKAFPGGFIVRGARQLRDGVLGAWEKITKKENEKGEKKSDEKPEGSVPVRFLGLWDTVSAYGLPIEELTRAIDKWFWPMTFRDASLPGNVEWARHALSLDDERISFTPVLWNESVKPNQSLIQVWFSGVHANVGGGYPDDSLAHVSLLWMLEEAEGAGLQFHDSIVSEYRAIASENGRLYDSRSGFGTLYRYKPRDILQLMKKAGTDTDKVRPLVDDSVILRLTSGNDSYAPVSLLGDVDVLTPDGSVESLPKYLPVGSNDIEYEGKEWTEGRKQAFDAVWWRRVTYFSMLMSILLALAFPLLADEETMGRWAIFQYLEHADPIKDATGYAVGWFAGMMRGLLPDYAEPWVAAITKFPNTAAGLGIILLFLLGQGIALQKQVHDHIRVAWSLPFRKRYEEQRPDSRRQWALRHLAMSVPTFALIVVLFLFDKVAGILLVASFGWAVFAVFRLAQSSRAEGTSALPQADAHLRVARAIRECRMISGISTWAVNVVFPAVVFALVLVLVVLAVSRGIYGLTNAAGGFCTGSSSLEAVPATYPSSRAVAAGTPFDTRLFCWNSGLTLEKGARYRITLQLPEDADWFDRTVHTDVGGFSSHHGIPALFAPMRRYAGENWFQPIARIGARGNDEYVLRSVDPLPKEPSLPAVNTKNNSIFDPILEKEATDATKANPVPQGRRKLVSEITARTSGELFLFVNDAAVMLPLQSGLFYPNNYGTADVAVERIEKHDGECKQSSKTAC
ncbi:MAG: DUF2235 domain-containing protein [Alphaproteobacteria bacterium]